ncbi:MAG: tRNA dihydrouridine synthase DusB [Desulfocapsaceae bacterium]|nr:tRNA dihydrouridine synthase DusB [Desulfocapsaceae bacterium]
MLRIADISIDSPFILAPLAGYTDLPFRMLCREYGAGMCVSEMISCHGLVYGQSKTMAMLQSDPKEHPVAFQLFGADPEIMGQAAAIAARLKPDCIDINMGCPVPKVTKRGAGAALMGDPLLAARIIKAVREQGGLPVTVKFRAGIDSSRMNAVSFARMAEQAGAAAVIVHGRTWAQGFTGKADWQTIARVKEALAIPVIGNGDVQSSEDGLMMMARTGCDGVMIGRGALGNPWAFTRTGRPGGLPSLLKGVFRHLELREQFFADADYALGSLKNHIGRYFKMIPGSAGFRRLVYASSSYAQLKENMSALRGEQEIHKNENP